MRAAFRHGKQTFFAFSGDHGTSYAAAIAYYTLLSVFPFAIFVIGLAGYFVTDHQRTQLTNKIASALGAALSGNIAQQVQSATHGNAGLSIIALITALWSASAVFGAIRNGLQAIWKVHSKRNYVVSKAVDLCGVFGLVIVLGVSLAATFSLTWISQVVKRLVGTQAGGPVSFVFGIGLLVLPVLIAFLAFSLLYTLASDPGIGWRRVWPGAVFGAIGFEVLNFGLSFYFRYFGNYAKVYGTIGGVIAFLFYAYLLGCLILLGGQLTDELMRKGVPRGQWRPHSAPRQTAAPTAVPEPLVVYAPARNGPRDGESVSAGDLFPARDAPLGAPPASSPPPR